MKGTYNGRTVAQSAAKLLERMKLTAARNMAKRCAAAASDDTPSNDSEPSPACQHWTAVSELLYATSALNLNPIFEQAEKDAAAMSQKQPKTQTKPTSTTKPADTAAAQPLTEEQQAQNKLQRLVEHFMNKLGEASATIQKHIEDLAKDPCYAMEWGKTAVAAAARHRVLKGVIERLSHDGKAEVERTRDDGTKYSTLGWLRQFATEEVLRRSRVPTYSTSPMSNLVEQEILAAWSEVLEIISWYA